MVLLRVTYLMYIVIHHNQKLSILPMLITTIPIRLFVEYGKHASIKIFSLEMVQSPFCPYISHVQCHTSQTNKNVYIITHTLVIYHTHHMHGLSHYR